MPRSLTLIQTIEIQAPAEKIFDFISDVKNDPHWRPEVEKMDEQGENKPGTIVIEYIRVYKFFRIITPTVIKILDRPNTFIVETPDTHPSWVKCIRSTETLTNGNTKFNVQLSFTLNNLKQVFPIVPPSFIVEMWYRPRMKKYMRNLKRLLEKANDRT